MALRDTPVIKICGLRDATATLAAVNAGATALGFILAPSRRRIQASEVRAVLQELPGDRPVAAGVVVNESARTIAAVLAESGVDIIQLSGDETPDLLGELDTTVWKSLRFAPGASLEDARRQIDPWLSHANPAEAIHLDAAVPGVYGGSGHLANWELAAALAELYPVVLAGGLGPGNVTGAIGEVRPLGVDVSSGVEVDGNKSPDLIRQFVNTARAAYARQPA